jgi:acyl carrier protein
MVSDREELFGEIRKALVELFELDEQEIQPQARLYEDLDIDSIDAVDLTIRLREMTGHKVDPEAFKAVRTVEDVVNATSRLVRAG